jgi:RNase P/RNase MRP subunit p29
MLSAKHLGRHELIGLRVSVSRTSNPTVIEYEGLVIDETMNTFTISDSMKNRVIPKTSRSFAFEVDGQRIILEGDAIRFRPEDRTKKFNFKKSGR